MPATTIIAAIATPRPPAPKRPAGPFPGYLTDEWFDYTIACMKRRTPAESRLHRVKVGIIDKKGIYTAPSRND